MANYLLIYNPIAGRGHASQAAKDIKEFFDEHYFDTINTKANQRLKDYVKLSKSYDAIIAIGGDGTVNEVAEFVYENQLNLGIIGMGSGNGLARHLELPLHHIGAFKRIAEGTLHQIDCAKWDNRFFVNVAGIGFDGYVAKLFDLAPTRGLKTYIYAIIKGIRTYSGDHYEIYIDGEIKRHDALMVSIANSGQFGNNTWIAPEAKLMDGLLDVVIVERITWWNVLRLGWMIKNKTLMNAKSVHYYKAKKIKINKFDYGYAHLDGEPFSSEKEVKIEVLPQALNIIK